MRMIEEKAEAAPFAPKRVSCPACEKLILLAPAGHYVFHFTPLGVRCKASGDFPRNYR